MRKQRGEATEPADESFPEALLVPFDGPRIDDRDTTFLTYYQLRGKIAAQFGDRWIRGGKDLFATRVAMFGGADFRTRFDESSRASASYLSALDELARDVGARAFSERTGPFEGLALPETRANELDSLDDAHGTAIGMLYSRLLLRAPTDAELAASFELLQSIHRSADIVEARDDELSFELSVTDPATQLTTRRDVTVPLSGVGKGVVALYLDQRSRDGNDGSDFVAHRVPGTIRLAAHDDDARLTLRNHDTTGEVTFHSVLLRATGSEKMPERLRPGSRSVTLDGSWKARGTGDDRYYTDGDEGKGHASVTVALAPEADGEYEVSLVYAARDDSARAVPIEIVHRGSHRIDLPPDRALPPLGEMHYAIDLSEDSAAFRDLVDRFRFGKDGFVEIRNEGTKKRVTADAVRFESESSGAKFLIDNHEAEGREGWKPFKSGSFRAYNIVGRDTYHDENKRKGELFLRYRPSAHDRFAADEFYRPGVGAPAKRDHETRAPVVVRANASSPIVRLRAPLRVAPGAHVRLDAATSFTVQRSDLEFQWRQRGGPKVEWTSDPSLPAGAAIEFVAPKRSLDEAAWVGLVRALVAHPDFLFTLAPSFHGLEDSRERRRLALGKLALDLVGRAPTQAEIAEIDAGLPLEKVVDRFLASEEFESFYFHRVRLYLESHGSTTQDEPARVWCYVAFNDRPFQEILTADYTVDANFERAERAKNHGKTGILTTAGFIEGKPGLPHYNYAAQVAEKFLGYVFEVPAGVDNSATAESTTDPQSTCYSCHKILTPLAMQRLRWTDDGKYRAKEKDGTPIDDTDRGLVADYAFAGRGMEAFATKAVRKERFIRTMLNAHFIFFTGREIRHEADERDLYRRLWDHVHADGFTIRGLIRAIYRETLLREVELGTAVGAGKSKNAGGAESNPPRVSVRSSFPSFPSVEFSSRVNPGRRTSVARPSDSSRPPSPTPFPATTSHATLRRSP